MDIYYEGMHPLYASKFHIDKKNLSLDFSTCMKVYHFLSCHPKIEVEISTDVTYHSSKNPSAVMADD
jgi:hypothetical protein